MRNGFDAEFEIENIIDDIRHYFATNGNKDTKAVIGISGGKDSTIAATLLCRALGKDRVFGVLMPDGEQKDIAHARKVCEYLNISRSRFDDLVLSGKLPRGKKLKNSNNLVWYKDEIISAIDES